MFDGVASSRTVIVFLRGEMGDDLLVRKFDGKVREDAEGCESLMLRVVKV